MVSSFAAIVFTILMLEPSQTVKSGPTATVGCDWIVTIIESDTSPVQGAILVAVRVRTISPVSLIPGIYFGFNVLIEEGSILPIPVWDHVNVEKFVTDAPFPETITSSPSQNDKEVPDHTKPMEKLLF